jgi:hypothetical protein
MTEELNFKSICDIATSTMNLPKGVLANKSRKRELQVVRQVAAIIGRDEENIHRKTIGKILNRDRSLINYYEHTHKPNYASYPLYRETFNKIYKAYKDGENSKEYFYDSDFMKKYLLKNGVYETKESDIILEIKSGETVCNIKTNYFEFSKQIVNIKEACSGYHITINIL